MNQFDRKFELKELTEGEDFDPSTIYPSAAFTQAKFYGDWQKKIGRKVRRFLITDEGKNVAYFQLIKYPLLLNKSYFYIPYGPIINNPPPELLIYLKNELKRLAKHENVVFLRLDFTPTIPDDILSKFFTHSPAHTYHSSYFQPRVEWYLNLQTPTGQEKTEEELLTDMHKNHRYSIRVADKEKITVEIVTDNFEKYFDPFYELMSNTAKRNGFSLHPKNYYKNIFENLPKPNTHLAIARSNDKILVIDLIIISGQVANYVFSGSSTEERNKMPSYLALWKSICYAKKLKCKHYNFGGITTDNNKNESWAGLTAFKKKFGGQEMKHSNFFDIVTNPFWYWLYNFVKFLRR